MEQTKTQCGYRFYAQLVSPVPYPMYLNSFNVIQHPVQECSPREIYEYRGYDYNEHDEFHNLKLSPTTLHL